MTREALSAHIDRIIVIGNEMCVDTSTITNVWVAVARHHLKSVDLNLIT